MGGERKSRRRRLRPGKIITQVIVFLLLGAIVNVAVAWAGALWDPADVGTEIDPDYATEILQRKFGEELEFVYKVAPGRSSSGLGVSHTYCLAFAEGNDEAYGWHDVRAGWPMRALAGQVLYEPDHRRLVNTWDAPRSYGYRGVPLGPLWPGFAVNTASYAIILWLLIPGPFVLRRVIRIRRGRCPKCGYDLRGAPPEVGTGGGCPECGWKRQPEARA